MHRGMTDKCPWRRPVHLHQLEDAHTEWKAAWWSSPELLYALFVLLYTLFFLADQNCCCCKYVLRTVDLCTTIMFVTQSLGNIREAAIAVQSSQTALFLYYYFSLYHYYFNYFCNYSHYCKTIFFRFGLEFIAEIRPIASSITGDWCL
jgi:hypothetical protein